MRLPIIPTATASARQSTQHHATQAVRGAACHSMAISGTTLLITLGIDAAIGLGACLLFSLLRILLPAFYAPRRHYASISCSSASPGTAAAALAAAGDPDDQAGAGLSGVPPLSAPLPPPLPRTMLLTWAWPVLRLPEEQLIASAGMDVAMLLRFIRFALKLLLVLSVWCVGVVLPVNLKGGNVASVQSRLPGAPSPSPSPSPPPGVLLIPMLPSGLLGNASTGSSSSSRRAVQLGPGQDVGSLAEDITTGRYVASDLDKFSMANIPPGSPLLWVHLASVFLVTGVVLLMLWSASASALRLHLTHLRSPGATAAGATHTALLRDIPGVSKGTLLDQVLHGALFKLLPPALKRRLRDAWRRAGGSATSARHAPAQAQQHQVGVSAAAVASGAPVNGAATTAGTSTAQPVAEGQEEGSCAGAHDAALQQVVVTLPEPELQPATARSLRNRRGNDRGSPVADSSSSSSARPGRVPSEWQRAADSLRQGTSLQGFVRDEFAQVHGAGSITAVHVVSFNSSVAKLVAQHATTRTALQDLLSHYEGELQRAAAAAARHEQRRLQAGAGNRGRLSVRAPFKAVLRALSLLPGQLPQPVVAPTSGQPAAQLGGGAGVAALAAAGLCEERSSDTPVPEGRAGGAAAGTKQLGQPRPRHHHSRVKPIKLIQLPLAQQQAGASDDSGGGAECRDDSNAGPEQQQQPRSSSLASHATLTTGSSMEGGDDVQRSSSDQAAITVVLPPFPSLPAALGSDGATHIGSVPAAALLPASASSPALADAWAYAASLPSNGKAAASPPRDSNGGGDSSSRSGCGSLPCCRRCPEGDALQVLLARLADIRRRLAAAQAAAEADPHPAALLTFRTRAALAAAVGGHHVAEAQNWHLTAAPPPDSLMWGQLGLRSWQVAFRRGLVHIVLVAVAFFYVLPVGIVQGILQLERLQRLPVIGTLVSLPVVRSLLLGVLPGLALRIFILLLPVLLYALNRRAGSAGQAEMDGHVATHFFGMQVVTVFLASFITGSLLNQLSLFVNSPSQVLTVLGTGVPQASNFFMSYILFSAFIGRSWMLLRPWGLLMTSLRLAGARAGGRRARQRAVLVGTYRMFGPAIPEHSIILLLALVFCVIAPFVLLCGLAFFAMALLVESYNWCFVFRRPYEGGGAMWQQVFRHVITGLYLFQVAMAALLGVKRFVWAALLLLPLAATLLVHRLGARLLQRSWGVMSMRLAHELDVADAQAAEQQHTEPDTAAAGSSSGASLAAAWGQLYCPPGERLLRDGPAIEAKLARAVAAMQARLAAHNDGRAAESAAAGVTDLRPRA